MEKKPAERTSLKRLVELVDEEFADWWHLPRSRSFYLLFFASCFILGVPLWIMFLVLLYVTEIQLGFAVMSFAVAFLAIGFSFLNTFVSSGAIDRILKEDKFRRICRSEKFKAVDTARNRLLAWALISMRERIPMRLAEAMEGEQTLFQDEILVRDAMLREAA